MDRDIAKSLNTENFTVWPKMNERNKNGRQLKAKLRTFQTCIQRA